MTMLKINFFSLREYKIRYRSAEEGSKAEEMKVLVSEENASNTMTARLKAYSIKKCIALCFILFRA